MKVSFLGIGNELLDGFVSESNSNWIANELATVGLSITQKLCVRDIEAAILEALSYLAGRSDGIIITGGLGPTEDDKTRECAALFLKKPLTLDTQILLGIQQKIQTTRFSMPPGNQKQAMVIQASQVMANARGTAPGFIIPGRPWIAAFPGVPSELEGMFPALLDFIRKDSPIQQEWSSVYIRTIGLPEAYLDEKLKALQYPGIRVGTIAHFGQVDLRLDIPVGDAEQAMRIAKTEMEPFPDIMAKVFSLDKNISIEQALIRLMTKKQKRIIFAESCTGGFISKRLTDIPGSSRTILGSLVTYDNSLKIKLLNVREKTLHEYGAVSFEAAFEMIEGLRQNFTADYYAAVTGIAGPEGGSKEKPVGTVFIGFGTENETAVMRFQFSAERENNRLRSVMRVFEILWDDLNTGHADYQNYSSLAGFWIK